MKTPIWQLMRLIIKKEPGYIQDHFFKAILTLSGQLNGAPRYMDASSLSSIVRISPKSSAIKLNPWLINFANLCKYENVLNE